MRQAPSEVGHERSDVSSDAPGLRETSISFDPAATSVDAIQRAAYRLSDRVSIEIDVGERISVVLHLCTDDALDECVSDFRNEVLDQTLRERIRLESEAARNLILAMAFSQTGLLGDE